MTRVQAWAIHAANLLVGGTGIAYAWTCYFVTSDDPWSIVNHPWQPHLQHAHILVAPLLVFAVASIWHAHVWRRIAKGHHARRKTGLALAGLLGPMVLSGYAIQITLHETWRTVWVGSHVATSCLWLAVMLVHPMRARRSP